MKVALFDFDGTIVYTEDLWIGTFDQFEEEYQLERTSRSERLRQMTNSVLALAEEYYERFESVRKLFESPQVLASYFNEKTEKRVHQTSPIDGVVEFIDELHSRNIPVIIASSGRKEHISQYLDTWGILVDDIVTGSDVVHPKPSADIYIEALRRSHRDAEPQECVVFEDNPKPALNASSVGFRVCMIKYHNNTIFTESFDFANRVITSFMCLVEELKRKSSIECKEIDI